MNSISHETDPRNLDEPVFTPHGDGWKIILLRDTWQDEQLDIYDLAVYVSLMSYVDNDNRCFPKVETLCKYARCSQRRVYTSLKRLEELGYIERESNGNYGRGNVYTVHQSPTDSLSRAGQLCTTCRAGVHEVQSHTRETHYKRNPLQAHSAVHENAQHESMSENNEPRKPQGGDRNAGWDTDQRYQQFIAAYPKRENVKAGYGWFRKALSKTNLTVLIAAATAYAQQVAEQGIEPRYVQTVAKWLEGERWNDRPTESAQAQKQLQAEQKRAESDRAELRRDAEKIHAYMLEHSLTFEEAIDDRFYYLVDFPDDVAEIRRMIDSGLTL